MLMPNLAAFAAAAPSGRLLGLDLGDKTIGLALSDTLRMVATPAEIIARSKFSKDVAQLQAMIAAQRVSGLVIGYPRNMDGSEGPRCQATRQFVRSLEPLIDLPMLLWDERLTTEAVTKTMLEADLSRARRKEMVDKLAAGFMLQGVLDALRGTE